MPNVDIHCHVVAPLALERMAGLNSQWAPRIIPREGGEYIAVNERFFGPVLPGMYDVAARLKDMEAAGIDRHVLSVVPLTFNYHLEPGIAVPFAQIQNDAIAALATERPQHFAGMATLPLQDVGAAVKELERAITRLGLKGAEIGTNVHGKNLDAPELFPLYEKAVELGVPLFVHPEDVAASERLRRFFMLNLVGNPLDTAIAIGCVTLGGVLERYPELKLIFAHGGGYAPYQRGRLEHGYRAKAEARQGAPRPPSEYFGLLHFDSLVHYGPALEYLVTTCGSDKVLLGSDYPFEMGDPDPVGSVRGLKGVSEEDRLRILGENAARLFRLG